MFGTPERLALGAEASEPRQPSNTSSNVRKRRAAKFKRYGAHGKIPSFYGNQAAQMGRLGAPAMSADRRRPNPCTAAGSRVT
jgi:hypothetical protein